MSGTTTITGGVLETDSGDDINGDGDFTDAGEHAPVSQPVPTNPAANSAPIAGHIHVNGSQDNITYQFNEQVPNADGSLTVYAAHEVLVGPTAVGELFLAKAECGLTGAPDPPPASISPPTISGATKQGQTLTEAHGSYTNNPTAFAYQWLGCDSAANNCAPIAGATSQSYVLRASDVGRTIRVRETASNAAGASSPASSAATSVVQALPVLPPPPPAPPPPPLVVDSTAPVANLSGSRSQKLGKTVAVKVSCASEPCIASASGTVKVPKVGGASAKTYKTKKIIKPIAKGATVKIKLGLSRAARRAIKRALRHGKHVTMKLTITVTDAAGNTKKLTRKVKLRL